MDYPHKLPELPYEYSALEPHIDTRTMAIHHDKHHAAYVNNLNKALENYPDLQEKSVAELLFNLDAVPEDIRTAVRNNGGGHINHSLFWRCMSAKGGGQPGSSFADAIEETFESFDQFKTHFSQMAMGRFGSGWVWLCLDSDSKLSIFSTANQDNPLSRGFVPILGLDVWEHAYYLKYENRRADYVAGWWNVVDWDFVAGNYVTYKVTAGVGQAVDKAKSAWSDLTKGWDKLAQG
jgi:Fe-Mn family superoxide dismutase